MHIVPSLRWAVVDNAFSQAILLGGRTLGSDLI
jgi:hypothetical protein